MTRRWLTAQIAVGAIITLFLGRTIVRNWEELSTYTITVSPEMLAGAVTMAVLGFSLVWLRWVLLVRLHGEPVGWRDAASLYALFQLSTYIPGGVWQYLHLNALAHRKAVSKRAATVGTVQHQLLGLIAATTVFAVFGGVTMLPSTAAVIGVIAVIGGGIILVHPSVLERLFNPALAWIGREQLRIKTGPWQLIGLYLLGVTSWVVTAVGFYLLTAAFTDVAFTPGILAVFPGAWVVGFVLLLSPGGLGVREAALLKLLEGYVTASDALVIAAASRLWILLPELALSSGAVVLARKHIRQRLFNLRNGAS